MSVKQTKSNLPGPGPGRPRGGQNKNTAAIKEMILTALNDAGGSDYLLKRANDPKTASAFLGLVGKVLPMQVTGADGNPLNVQFNVKFD